MTSELDDVEALLERVRPDPGGFAQRLLSQVMTRFGETPPDPTTFYTAIDVEPPMATTASVDTNMLLAAALGACECWGLRTDCPHCRGDGGTGWLMPDRELFEELIRPAVARVDEAHERGGER
jgi:hypothetical protein